MRIGSVTEDKFFVIRLFRGEHKYAYWYNNCSWQETSSVAAATKISDKDVNKELNVLIELGYKQAHPVYVHEIYDIYDTPKDPGDVKSFDILATHHPYYLYPRLAVSIIKLKSSYAGIDKNDPYEQLRADNVKKEMAAVLNTYKGKYGVVFCPRCNAVEDGSVVTPETFGHVMTWVTYGTGYSGYECENCHYQRLEKIEHWE